MTWNRRAWSIWSILPLSHSTKKKATKYLRQRSWGSSSGFPEYKMRDITANPVHHDKVAPVGLLYFPSNTMERSVSWKKKRKSFSWIRNLPNFTEFECLMPVVATAFHFTLHCAVWNELTSLYMKFINIRLNYVLQSTLMPPFRFCNNICKHVSSFLHVLHAPSILFFMTWSRQ